MSKHVREAQFDEKGKAKSRCYDNLPAFLSEVHSFTAHV